MTAGDASMCRQETHLDCVDHWVPRLKRGMTPKNVVACRHQRASGASRIGQHGETQALGNWPRPPAGDAGDPHLRIDEKLLRAQDLLVERDRGAPDLLRRRNDVEHIVHARGPRNSMRIERTTKAKPGVSLRGVLEQRAVAGAEQPQWLVRPRSMKRSSWRDRRCRRNPCPRSTRAPS